MLDSRTSSMVLIFLTLLGWIFVIVMLAEPESWFKLFWGGCGIFTCTGGGNPANGGCGLSSYAKACQAFGVMAVLLISFMLVIHTIQILGKGSLIPASIQPHLRWVHIVAAVFITIVWVLEAAWIAKGCKWGYGRGRWETPSVAYGLFFGVFVMITEIVCWWLCASSGAPSLSGCQALIN